MADMFKLQIITPDRIFYEEDVSMVELTTTQGDIGVYKNHIPMTYIVAPGIIKMHENNEVKKAALMSGFLEILPDRITVLAEVVEWPDEIDINRAREAKVRAERRLQSGSENINLDRAEMALKRALVRLELR